MIGSGNSERASTPDDGSADKPADPSVALARLRWRLAAYRRSAIQRVEDCIAGVAALRRQLNDRALDTILDGFQSVRADLGAMDSARPIRPADLQALLDRLAAFQADLARFAAARPGADLVAGGPPSCRPVSARS